jgi:hypothetical protein
MAKAFEFVPLDLYGNNKNRERPVIAIYKDGRTRRFPSARDGARFMGVPSSNIVACLKGRLKTAGGCGWEYEDDFCSNGERKDNG